MKEFNVKTLFELLISGNDTLAWVFQVFSVVFAVVVINAIAKRLIKKAHAQSEKTENLWDDALFEALARPLNFLVWIIGLSFAADIVYLKTQAALFESIAPVRDVGVITMISWFLVRLVRNIEQSYIQGRERKDLTVDQTTVHAIGKLLRLSVIITGVLVGLQTLGFSISGVLAFGGVGGLAVGFAAKDLLANFFGGLMVYLDRPFAVGDWIRSPDKEIEGTVEEIGWRLTRIRKFDKRPLYVPNSVFTSIAVENPSRMSHRRIYETIGIRYADIDAMHSIVESVKQMLLKHQEIDTSQTMIVNFNAFNASSIDFFVYTFTKTTQWVFYHEVKQDVLLKIAGIIESHQAEIAFPTRTLHLEQTEGPSPLEQHLRE